MFKLGKKNHNIFNFKKKSKEVTIERNNEEVEEVDTILTNSELRREHIAESCKRMIDATKQLEHMVDDYAEVTSYISDIQKVSRADKVKQEKISESVINILDISREKEDLLEKGKRIKKINPEQFDMIEEYGSEIEEEIKKIEQYESDNSAIKRDLKIINSEKKLLKDERQRLLFNRKFISVFSKVGSVFIVLFYLMILCIIAATDKDLSAAIFVTTVVAACMVMYVTMSLRQNDKNLRLNEAKMNKAIGLGNKVMIKYYNSINLLEYATAKFNVKNSFELVDLWEGYRKEKEFDKRRRNYSESMRIYERQFRQTLKEVGVKDIDVWYRQLSAFSNISELEKVSNALEKKREGLRLEINRLNSEIDENKLELKRIIALDNAYKEEIIGELKKLDIVL